MCQFFLKLYDNIHNTGKILCIAFTTFTAPVFTKLTMLNNFTHTGQVWVEINLCP